MTALAGEALGTRWQVHVASTRPLDEAWLRRAIEARLQSVVAQMSQWASDSVLSSYNRAPPGAWTKIPDDFRTVLATAMHIAEDTQGAFDPTFGRVAALLGFGAETVDRPAKAADLAAAARQAGYRKLRFDEATASLRQPGGLWLDFSGIAKGFAVDAVSAELAALGCRDTLVEIGGELLGRGLSADGQPWWVDLEDPVRTPLPPLRLALHERAVATSGDYIRGAHTIDPRTGWPLDSALISVSVIHTSAMLADAWATALTVLGPEAGLRAAAARGIAARFLARRGTIEQLSPALMRMLDD